MRKAIGQQATYVSINFIYFFNIFYSVLGVLKSLEACEKVLLLFTEAVHKTLA